MRSASRRPHLPLLLCLPALVGGALAACASDGEEVGAPPSAARGGSAGTKPGGGSAGNAGNASGGAGGIAGSGAGTGGTSIADAGAGGAGQGGGEGGGAAGADAGTSGNAGTAGAGGTQPSAGAAGTTSGLPALTVSVGTKRTHENAAIVRSSYDYAPSVMLDGVYKMWWCGGVAGDHVLYAEASSLDGPWHAHGKTTAGSYDDVFQPTGNGADFDGVHTCDPSVVRVDGTYYLFYGGLGTESSPDATTRIGVASGPDGRSFTRLNGGKPIVVPARDHNAGFVNEYGAGQPSVIWKDGKFYLIFTDSTGLAINPGNGAGQFVMRSADPTFQKDVEELSADGFVPFAKDKHTSFSILESFSVDWQYVDAMKAFAIASHTGGGETRVYLFDDQGKKLLGGQAVSVPGPWHEGPGIASRPDKHAIPGSACNIVPFDVMRAVGGEAVGTWNLGHTGADLVINRDCAQIDQAKVYEGSLISSAGTPLTLVVGGERLQFASAAPANRLARNHFQVSSEIFGAVPYGGGMQIGATVIGAPDRPPAFKLDQNRLWPSACLELITDNGSNISYVSVGEFDGLPGGHALYCLR